MLSFSLGTYENYLGPELARLIGVAERTLRKSFANVLMLPGGRVFFLASDGPLTADVARAHRDRPAWTAWFVNRGYLKGMLTPDRMADVRRAISTDGAGEQGFQPACSITATSAIG